MSEIKLGNKTYPLLLTTGATKEIAKRYGGLDKLGDKLLGADKFDEALSEVIWLITLLANQAAKREQLLNPDTKVELLTEEALEILTSPSDLAQFKDAITECMQEGTKREILSEEKAKNI